MAGAAGKPQARYLVEKAQPHHVRSVAEVSEELDPRSREIVLVRDFRDVACSMLAYSRRQGSRGIWAGRGGLDRGHDPLAQRQPGRARWSTTCSGAAIGAHLVRYEELMTSADDTLRATLEFIGADARPETVASMRAALARERDRAEHHATTSSAAQSIGRWREEFDAGQRELAEHLFRPHLDALGYE